MVSLPYILTSHWIFSLFLCQARLSKNKSRCDGMKTGEWGGRLDRSSEEYFGAEDNGYTFPTASFSHRVLCGGGFNGYSAAPRPSDCMEVVSFYAIREKGGCL